MCPKSGAPKPVELEIHQKTTKRKLVSAIQGKSVDWGEATDDNSRGCSPTMTKVYSGYGLSRTEVGPQTLHSHQNWAVFVSHVEQQRK
jgi:hypothetical protein